MFRSPAPPAAPAMLGRAEDAHPDSALGQAVARRRRVAPRVGETATLCRDLERQRDGYAAIIQLASPGSDMIELAAAQAGLSVVEKALIEARRVDGLAAEDGTAAEDEITRLLVEYRRVWRELVEGPQTDRPGRPHAALRAEIVRLAGEVGLP